MVPNIYSDEILSIRENVQWFIKKNYREIFKKEKPFENVYLICDGMPVSDYIIPALVGWESCGFYIRGHKWLPCSFYKNAIVVDPIGDFKNQHKEMLGQYPYISAISYDDMLKREHCGKELYIILCDSNNKDSRWYDIITDCGNMAAKNKQSYIMVGTLLPPVPKSDGSVTAFGEREYSYVIESKEDKTPEEEFYIGIEKHCRLVAKNTCSNINLLRYDNLVGSTGCSNTGFDFEKVIKTAVQDGAININPEDRLNYFSFIHCRDAAFALISTVFSDNFGHVYNVTRYNISVAEFKVKLCKVLPEKIGMNCSSGAINLSDCNYRVLSPLKALHQGCLFKSRCYDLDSLMYRSACAVAEIPFDVQTKLGCYQGKLQRLKDIEIDILKEIDRICKENDIKYFLAGGSLLGAIRNNKSIPWDDDLDIGMLREDFEKFRRICPDVLDTKYYYSSPWTDPNCHYYLDKVRLKSSYFSTAYSNRFTLEDGVFVDIIVYDQTSNFKFLENLQIFLINFFVALIYVRWHNQCNKSAPRNTSYYRLLNILSPIVKLIPWKLIHGLFDKSASMFSKKKKAKYLIDSIGQHIHYGRFPKYLLEDIEYTEFDGVTLPIPKNYHEYLKFFYGENYLPNPSLTAQVGAHRIARLDLGEYLYEDKQPGDFREVNIYGELYEAEYDGVDYRKKYKKSHTWGKNKVRKPNKFKNK